MVGEEEEGKKSTLGGLVKSNQLRASGECSGRRVDEEGRIDFQTAQMVAVSSSLISNKKDGTVNEREEKKVNERVCRKKLAGSDFFSLKGGFRTTLEIG